MKRTMLILITLIMSIMLIGCESNEVKKVKNGYFPLDDSITIGTAVDTYKYIESYDWKSFESTRDRTIVELNFDLVDYGVGDGVELIDGEVKVQFRIKKRNVAEDELPFELHYTEFKGVMINTNNNQTKEFDLQGINDSQKISLWRSIFYNDPIFF